MKVSLRWLEEFVELPTSDPREIRQALISLGHEVEGIEELEADWTGVVIAEVLSIDPHPDADKVRVCQVTTGADPIQVICGAWNFDVGAVVPFAVPGAVLPGDFRIGVRNIRGVESNGMICSERELGLGDEHAGILVLDDDAPVGADFADWVELPDVVFDLAITPNRPDAMSMLGVARDLAAHFDAELRRPVVDLEETAGSPTTRVEILDPVGCRRFTLRELRDVTIGPSPFWMRRRIRAAGMRPISNIVDVTNYVMVELGHPLHAFDGDRVAGDRLEIRRAAADERLTTLDDVDRPLTADDLVICDDNGPTSLAGTMGGAESEVVDTTTRVLLEAATWDPPTILHMSRRHGLRSEASARFERGVDPELPLEASARAAALLLQTGGGTLLAGAVDVVATPHRRTQIELSVTEVTRTLGAGFSSDEIAAALRSIELEVSGSDPLLVTVPGFRPDLERPIDLVEEIARLRGFDWFGESVPTGVGGGWSPEQRRERTLRSVLTGIGLNQAVNLSFIGEDDLTNFSYPAMHDARRVVGVKNPLREEESLLRTTLLPGLMRSLRFNLSHGATDVGLFETGKVFFARPSGLDARIPDQPDRVAIALVGSFGGLDLAGAGRPVDFFVASAIVRLLAERLGCGPLHFDPAEEPGFHPGRCAVVRIGENRLGVVGEVHPSTAARYDLPGRVAAAELELAPLVAAGALHQLDPPSTFPPVEFDLAFAVPTGVPAMDLVEASVGPVSELCESATVFDEYVGGSLGDGRKSLAIRYVLRAGDRTLTNEEVAPLRKAMTEAATALGAELRGQA